MLISACLCAYVLAPGKATPNIITDFIASESIAGFYRIICPQIGNEFYPKAIYGLTAAHKKWPEPPLTPTRLTSDRQVNSWIRLCYPNLMDNRYIYVLLHKKGHTLDPPSDGEIRYTTEEEHEKLVASFLQGGDD